MSAQLTITNRNGRWEVDVPAGWVATIPFVAPFSTLDAAESYVAYWQRKGAVMNFGRQP